MSRTIATTSQRWRFGDATPESVPVMAIDEPPSSAAMKLLMLFILVMYSSIGMLVPAANAVRPAMTIAIGAVIMTFVELGKTGKGFRIAWPESGMLVALLAVCTISSFSAIWLAQGVATTSDFARIVVLYVVIENIVTSPKRLRAVLLTLSIAGLMPALGTIHHFLTGQVVENSEAAKLLRRKTPFSI